MADKTRTIDLFEDISGAIFPPSRIPVQDIGDPKKTQAATLQSIIDKGLEAHDFAPGGAVIPPGGLLGQVLKKLSGDDYDVEWQDESGGIDSITGYDPIYVETTDPENPAIGIASDAFAAPGAGVKPGGAAGQVYTKTGAGDNEAGWSNPPGGEYVTFTPQDAAAMPNITLFVDQADGLLKFKKSDGTLMEVGLAPVS